MTNAKNGSPPAELSGALTLVLDQAAGSLRVSDGAGRNEVVGLSLLADAASLVAAARAAGNLVRLFLPDVVGAAATESATSILPVDEAQPLPAPDRLPPPTSPDESFVAADRVYREAAINLGYRALPHAALARRDGEPRNWLFAALIGPRELLERLDAVPYDLSRRPDGSWSLLAALLAPEVKHAVTLDIDVQRLAFDVARDDAYIVAAPGLRIPTWSLALAGSLVRLGPCSDRNAWRGGHRRIRHPRLTRARGCSRTGSRAHATPYAAGRRRGMARRVSVAAT